MPWAKAGDILRGWKKKAGMEEDRMLILHQVWEREVGGFARQWSLSGVKGGTLYVKPRSPAAAQELQLRGGQLVKSLNKYFKRAWIRAIRVTQGR